ncbi:hypothetical protein [Elizabethkingia anophelis]|uniref:hypothetical protein n=1 Tax=Elizabethkingia anophelis TaxID=1117645 RepID=UPI00389183C9
MQKLIFILIVSFFCSIDAQEKIASYTEVSVNGQEGMSDKASFKMLGDKRYRSIIKEFEDRFKKNNNGYSDYYRLYGIDGSVTNIKGLSVYLIPKSIVSEENKKRKEYRVIGDKRTLWTYYDLKTKKIYKIRPSSIFPDL